MRNNRTGGNQSNYTKGIYYMKLEEFTTKYQELSEEQKEDLTKLIQGEQDVVRTEYSKQIKELEKFKPVDLTAEQKELETLRSEMKNIQFRNSLREMGVPNDLAGFIDTRNDVEQVRQFFEGFGGMEKLQNFVPNSKNMGDTGVTKEQFKNMSYGEKAKLYTENAELYEQLNK